MISASALKPHCGYARVLSKARPPKPEQQEAIDKGVQFHAAVELWIRGGRLPEVRDMEVQGWLDLMASIWTPSGLICHVEVAWGLTPDGRHVDVDEPKPHVYCARDGSPLLTAGRADLAAWLRAPGYGDVLESIDYKAGRWPVTSARENLQVNAAGRALALCFGKAHYRPVIYYARDGVFDVGDVVTIGSVADQVMFQAVSAAALLDETPRPGEWCASCWERRGCKSAAPEDAA